MNKIIVEYWLKLRGARVTSANDFYQFVKELASFATVGGAERDNLPDVSGESQKRMAACRGAAKVRMYQEEEKVGSFALELPIENFDQTRLEVTLLLGVVAGDMLGNPEIQDVKILSIEVPHILKKHMKGPKVGLDGVKQAFNLGKRPLLAFTAKPRLGLSAEDHARICFRALKGGADLAEDDERLVNPDYCPATERVKRCVAVAEQASAETGEKKVYSVNLTGRDDEIIAVFEQLDGIARTENGRGLECPIIISISVRVATLHSPPHRRTWLSGNFSVTAA